MAIQHAPLFTKNLHFLPKIPLTNTHLPCLSPNPKSLVRLLSFPTKKDKQFGTHGRVKCTMDYNNNGQYERSVASQQHPRPSVIQWKKELCNSVQLIGIVATPVQIKHLSSGKVLAWSRLAVKKSPTDTAWINLTFWDELAHVASQHIEKGHQIYVSGRLVSDTVEADDGKQQTYYKVKNYAANTTGSTEELWQAFFANPVDWWDNRKNKRSPNYPDFKHKDTGEALWIEGRYNPPWVKSQLSILDSRLESFQDQQASMGTNFMNGGDFTPF
ncbi:hypothetical protein RJ640_019660 [Escallonia rubra]|uniref:Uncharacterized protein n=1 Tax=Escallonia rubra TaxID=112253 RepID=A0AA88QIP9_9ASTE|nr:hypothetical protein RJ640_019660 [Escallonia rubra]